MFAFMLCSHMVCQNQERGESERQRGQGDTERGGVRSGRQ